MKKLLILLIAFSTFNSIFAQSRKIDEARKVMNGTPDDRTVNNERRSRVPGGESNTSRDESIDQINNEYGRKINAVRRNPTLSQAEKERRIRELENQRDRKINSIKRGRDDNDGKKGYKKNKQKGNNGKHLGWEKGVGNPHRGDGDYKRHKRDNDDDDRNDDDDDDRKSKQKNKKK